MIKQKLAKLGIMLVLSFAFVGTATTSVTATEKTEAKKVDNEVEFSLNANTEKDLKLFKVSGFKAFKLEDGYKFVVNYESEKEGDYRITNFGPNWYINQFIKGGIKKGKNELKFKITDEDYKKLLDKKEGFGAEISLDKTRLSLDVYQDEVKSLKDKAIATDDVSVDESRFTGKINYNFWYEGNEFKPTKVSAYKIKGGVKFEVAYDSKISGDYTYASYGEETGIEHVIKGGLKKGKHTAKFMFTDEEFEKVKNFNSVLFFINHKNDRIEVMIPMGELAGIEDQEESSKDASVDKSTFTGKINFNFWYKGKALRVNKVSAYRVKKGIKFEVAYKGTIEGDYFYGSWGDKGGFDHRILGGLKKGKHTAKFIVSNADFKKALKNEGIFFATVYKGQDINAFINMDELRGVESMKKISSDESIDESVFNENLSFEAYRDGEEGQYKGKDFVIKSFVAKKLKEGVKFIVDYESKEACDYGYFSANNDLILKNIKKGIKKGSGTAKFKLTKKELEIFLKKEEGLNFKVDIGEKPIYYFVHKDIIAPIKSVKKIEKDESVDISRFNETLQFYTEYRGKNFKLTSLQLNTDKNGYKIEGKYESKKAGSYSYYASETFSFEKKVDKGIKKGKGSFSFVLSEKELNLAAEKGLVISPEISKDEEVFFTVGENQFRRILEI